MLIQLRRVISQSRVKPNITNDNAKWIKENRFLLENVSDELMHCSNISHPWPEIDAEAVQCMIRMAEYADDVGSITDDIGSIILNPKFRITSIM